MKDLAGKVCCWKRTGYQAAGMIFILANSPKSFENGLMHKGVVQFCRKNLLSDRLLVLDTVYLTGAGPAFKVLFQDGRAGWICDEGIELATT